MALNNLYLIEETTYNFIDSTYIKIVSTVFDITVKQKIKNCALQYLLYHSKELEK